MSEARLCVWRRGVAVTQREERQKREKERERAREREGEGGAERQHSPHIRGSDKDLGRRV